MTSEYEHASPDTKVFGIQINHAYATLITMLSQCMIGIANDRNSIVFQDKDGNTYKTLQDASGDAVMTENCIPYINSTGQATHNNEFKIDFTNARIVFPLPFTLAFGDQDTNGSMRIRITTDGIYFGKRVSGSWDEAEFEA